MYKVIIVRQYERTPLLDLKTVLLTGNLMTAAWLRALEILSTEPGLVDNLQRARKKETKKVNECKPLNFQTEMPWVGFHTLFIQWKTYIYNPRVFTTLLSELLTLLSPQCHNKWHFFIWYIMQWQIIAKDLHQYPHQSIVQYSQWPADGRAAYHTCLLD